MTADSKARLLKALYDGMVEDPSIEYPDTDGEPMAESEEQLLAMIDAISVLREWYADNDDIYVGGDLMIYYRMNDNQTRVAPDVFMVLGTHKGRRRSWRVWQEGKAPDFVMEMASGSTWRRDMREKRDIYTTLDVTEYWRFDPSGDHFTPHLIGERLVDGEYRPLPVETGEDGTLRGYSEILGLDIYVLPGLLLRFYDPVSRQWLLTLEEEASARQAAETALQSEASARQAAETALQSEASARQAAETALQSEALARQELEEEIRRLRQQLSAEG